MALATFAVEEAEAESVLLTVFVPEIEFEALEMEAEFGSVTVLGEARGVSAAQTVDARAIVARSGLRNFMVPETWERAKRVESEF